MTPGSACAGLACIDRGDDVRHPNVDGEITLGHADRIVEYRRDGIARAGRAGRRVGDVRDVLRQVDCHAATCVLSGSAAAVDADESNLLERIIARRADAVLSEDLNERAAV